MTMSALYWAVVRMRDIDTIEDLLKSGVYNHNECDSFGTTILMQSTLTGHTDITRLLLEYGADPNLSDCFGNTPLTLATCDKQHGAVLALLEFGANPNICDRQQNSPLIHAAYAGCTKSAQHLLDYGAYTQLKDNQGLTAADYAIDKGYADIALAIQDADEKRERAIASQQAEENSRNRTIKSGLPVNGKIEGLPQIHTKKRGPKP